MATMTATWTTETAGTIQILDGSAAGTYPFTAFDAVSAGILNLGTFHISGKAMQLKIQLEKNLPGLLGEITQRKATALAATRPTAARTAQNLVDRQMARAGFSSGSAALDNEHGFRTE